jgi:AraC family L-rhamnose operon transcriptional activator RhaR/AraC family L-rhamnose operon regulatory protein RhaS
MFRTLKTKDWFHRDGFPIAVERRELQEQFGLHSHEFSEIVLVTGGHGLHVTDVNSWTLATGDVFVIGGPRAHEYRDIDRLSLINILFQPQRLQLQTADLSSLAGYHALFSLEPVWRRRHNFDSRLHLSPKELSVVSAHVDQLDEELKQRAPGFTFMATACFMQIIGYLSRCYGRTKNPNSRALLRIAETISHLETHLDEERSLDDLATMASMSKRSFIRAFKEATGSSPIAYLLQSRVSRAAALLRRDDSTSITEVAFQSGFTDSNYFTRQFRKIMGLSPRSYRQQQLVKR